MTGPAASPPYRLVTTGLDPVVHAEVRLSMDGRIKSGHDESGAAKESSECHVLSEKRSAENALIYRRKFESV
jgi:hypothetical protein